MAKVRATQTGYYGRQLRMVGEVFEADVKASWFEPVGGKEQAQKAEPAAPKVEEPVTQAPANDAPVDLNAMTVKDLRALAKDRGIGLGADVTTKAEIVAAIEAGAVSEDREPFADAPEPVRVSNEINDATGATQPDWVAGGQADI